VVYRPGPAPGLRYAGLGIRLAAALIDSIPLAALAAAVIPGVNARCITGSSTSLCVVTIGGAALGGFAAAIGVYWVVSWRLLGGSLAQRALGLRVVNANDGQRVGVLRAAVRLAAVIIAALPFGVGLLWAGLDAQKQGWHDKIAGTFVVRRA